MKRVLERGVRPRDWTISDTQKSRQVLQNTGLFSEVDAVHQLIMHRVYFAKLITFFAEIGNFLFRINMIFQSWGLTLNRHLFRCILISNHRCITQLLQSVRQGTINIELLIVPYLYKPKIHLQNLYSRLIKLS
ncbi:hypothetical protein B0F87_102116 [Methylobacter tundripaludum]|uniref:Uncharacterized protein n=1 Tax=Methylobacter tundripaludum TaxID=173365 RepID=A0A2S6HHR8_9GAMM|nr:hypothetical protein B0F87_102116 [Methylobacter tundripaludum]